MSVLKQSKSNISTKPINDLEKIAIIILNWNGWRDTIRCLESVQRIAYSKWSIIVVDNGSTDNSVNEINMWLTKELGLKKMSQKTCMINGCYSTMVYNFSGILSLTLLALDKNLGVSGGRNVATEWALQDETVKYLFFLDNDAQIESNTISVCVDLAKNLRATVVGCLVKNENGTIQFAGSNFLQNIFYIEYLMHRSLYRETRKYWEADMVGGCAMLVKRNILEEIIKKRGYFFPNFFLYAEDQEFCLVVKRLGHKVVMARDALIYHKISRGSASLHTAYYYSSRNRMFLANEFLPLGLKILFHFYYPAYRLMRAFCDLIQGKASVSLAHLEGLVDGYRGVRGKWRKQY